MTITVVKNKIKRSPRPIVCISMRKDSIAYEKLTYVCSDAPTIRADKPPMVRGINAEIETMSDVYQMRLGSVHSSADSDAFDGATKIPNNLLITV